ncbi:CAF1-domain-containing protein [Delitschia confertaspora ATCC 74209]|uniref:CAF1-domain-containing protein n=1 Tax=Delitschia confertaspora ATCC 74209 TaxID=1513339 RepID=A0A9P4JEH2_9PLEO|nr:CAF1-domain-containing protein [Delitschia confertaspora ATCC 74209]
MDIDAVSFPSRLIDILEAISEADFVSIDLEMSGVPSRARGDNRGMQTLEMRYAELKESAEKYQVLQVGVTCCKFDILKDHYILRPYNINISPLISERLDIERDFTFQNGAVEFLLGHGFHFQTCFTKGVQYLSREEANLAKTLAWNRLENKNVIADLQLADDAVESLDFVRRVREAILAWSTSGKETLLITSAIGKDSESPASELSRFEKRLVHQLVRAEFPECVTISKPAYILIIQRDEEREADIVRKRKLQVREKITHQSGFRWIVEALAKANLDEIHPSYFTRNGDGERICINYDHLESRFRRVTHRIHMHQPVLVGHNLFTDLVYFYRTFIGQLPDTVDGFRKAVHELFPVIVDTKYMATHKCGDLNPMSSLQDVANQLDLQPLPNIAIHPKHSKYGDTDAAHEAGYDSLLTATVMIRLSAKLEEKGGYTEKESVSDSDGSYHTAPEIIEKPNPVKVTAPQSSMPALEQTHDGAADNVPSQVMVTKSSKKKRRKRKSEPTAPDSLSGSRFATSNLFERLTNLNLDSDVHDAEDLTEPVDITIAENIFAQEDDGAAWEARAPAQEEDHWQPTDPIVRAPMELMPPFGSEFWRVYGNKLRIFGTQETVLDLSH